MIYSSVNQTETVSKEKFGPIVAGKLVALATVDVSLHILEEVEPGVHLLIIPLDGGELVEAVDGGQ